MSIGIRCQHVLNKTVTLVIRHITKMNTLARAGKEALKQLGTRGFASSGSLPDRKVAVLGAAGMLLSTFFVLFWYIICI